MLPGLRWDGRSRTGHSIYGEGRGNVVYGSEGTVTISRNGYKVYDLHGKLLKEENEATQSVTTGMGGGGDITTKHIQNFFQTVRGEAKPNSVLKEAAASSHLNHLANIAYKAGLNLKVNPSNGHIQDEELMKKYWTRKYEPGWEPKL